MGVVEHIAILGGSGSGKTELSLKIASMFDCAILSLDSLSVFKEIDIASAKPSMCERGDIHHFGIDVISPDCKHNVCLFIDEYKKALEFCRNNKKILLIVGGSSFYLKSLLSGISDMPNYDHNDIKIKISSVGDTKSKYAFLETIDSVYASKLKPTDSYRIDRALTIYFATNTPPSIYFQMNKPEPLIDKCKIFEILLDRDKLLNRVVYRTSNMFERGIICEVETLISKYGIGNQWNNSIGIKEVYDLLLGNIDEEKAKELITTHTMQLAKRQRIFNKTQFESHLRADYNDVLSSVIDCLKYV